MPRYRRPAVTGATVFFTVALADRGSDLLVREVSALRDAVRATLREQSVGVEAWVVLPDHLHCVWTMPEGDGEYSTRRGALKERFSTAMRRVGFAPQDPVGRQGEPRPTALPEPDFVLDRRSRRNGSKPDQENYTANSHVSH